MFSTVFINLVYIEQRHTKVNFKYQQLKLPTPLKCHISSCACNTRSLAYIPPDTAVFVYYLRISMTVTQLMQVQQSLVDILLQGQGCLHGLKASAPLITLRLLQNTQPTRKLWYLIMKHHVLFKMMYLMSMETQLRSLQGSLLLHLYSANLEIRGNMGALKVPQKSSCCLPG